MSNVFVDLDLGTHRMEEHQRMGWDEIRIFGFVGGGGGGAKRVFFFGGGGSTKRYCYLGTGGGWFGSTKRYCYFALREIQEIRVWGQG